MDELADALAKSAIDPAQASKARHAVAACKAGVPRVHVINGTRRRGPAGGGLLEPGHRHARLRERVPADPARAQARRARIEQLIHASVESEELLPRSQAAIEKQLDDYYLYEVDRNPVACVALHAYPRGEARASWPACASVRRTRTRGSGVRMVQYVEERAREAGLRTLIALSTQAFNFFKTKAGFAEGSPEDLPPGRRERYEQSGRRSRVLTKQL